MSTFTTVGLIKDILAFYFQNKITSKWKNKSNLLTNKRDWKWENKNVQNIFLQKYITFLFPDIFQDRKEGLIRKLETRLPFAPVLRSTSSSSTFSQPDDKDSPGPGRRGIRICWEALLGLFVCV